MRYLIMAAAVLATGCRRESAPTVDDATAVDATMPTVRPPAPAASASTTPSPAATPARSYLGRWTGVEGMFLDVAAGDAPGHYKLTMQYDLDHRQTADATLDGERLVFTRDGAEKALRPTDGKATGLKYLADKKNCLTVAPGEGYCRD